MDGSKDTSLSDEGKKLLLLVWQLSRRVGRAGTSLLRPSPRRGSVPAMAFTNPFGRSTDAEEGRSSSESRRSSDTVIYHDVEKDSYPILVSIKSARSSVSSFFTEHLHPGGTDDLSWKARGFFLLGRLQPVMFLLLPAFLLGPINRFVLRRPSRAGAAAKRLGPTAYLDGLRGVAAFTVYIFHYGYLWMPKLRKGFASEPDNDWFWQRPIIRVLHSGRASVTVFFVISGYVLTLKTLKMIHARRNDQVLHALSGSAFRRPLRLFLPISVATFMIALICRGGWYMRDPSYAPVPPVAETFNAQMHHLFWDFVDLVNPFKGIKNRENIRGMDYDGHLWTIPIEFRGSLLVFVLLLTFARARRCVHAAASMMVVVWLVHLGDWDKALFPAGMLLAELSIVLPAQPPPRDILPRCNPSAIKTGFRRLFTMIRHVVTIGMFIFGCHLMSYPEQNGPITPGYMWMTSRTPAYFRMSQDRVQLHWLAVGSIIFILSLMYSPPANLNVRGRIKTLLRGRNIETPWYETAPSLDEDEKEEMAALSSAAVAPRTTDVGAPLLSTQPPLPLVGEPAEPLLQQLFTSRLAQYLGRISYSLYLWHDTVNHTVGMRWLVPAWAALVGAHNSVASLPPGTTPEAAYAMLENAWENYNSSLFWGALFNTLALLWVSDVFNRLVDVPCVKITHWIGEKCFRKD
ncbi:hypothetical protein CSOJ01_13580 [Colletotrichum sojae]|uniref:Acyltransferase 3 domain-containing protein n=1 Tax=Colletotrichum sojae TaxID=2175907 RepID=A0A8H6ISG5_9PEZI|nr:hypothetical protein CSOJ01_13580 [Colletotrichum sojae]